MSYKPDESTLISFLYNELSREEEQKVKTYLASDTKAKKELDEIRHTMGIMGKLEDKEVEAPSFVYDKSAQVIIPDNTKQNNSWKSILAIAASISLLLIVGYLTRFNVSNKDGFQISFGDQNSPAENTLDEENLRSWMEQSLASNNELLLSRINEVEQSFDDKASQLNGNVNQVNYKIDQELIDQYVDQISRENREIILSLLETSNRDQQKYLDEVLTDFANYVDQQRQNDFDWIQNQFTQIVNNRNPDDFEDYRNSE